MEQMLIGAISVSFYLAGLYFFRFWHRTRDRFFLCFALAFWMESANRAILGLRADPAEDSPLVYGIRLLAYGLILFAIWQKNRGGPRE
jgi:hypothetical protein